MESKVIRYDGRNVDIFNHIDALVKSPVRLMRQFMDEGTFSIPREKRFAMLKTLLEDSVEKEKTALIEKKKDQDNKLGLVDKKRLDRIERFDQLSETQCESELVYYDDERLLYKYKEKLWELVLSTGKDRNVDDAVYGMLLDSLDETPNTIETIETLSESMNLYFHDAEGTLDGLRTNDLKIILNKTSSVDEIARIGRKYQVNIPKTITKPMFKEMLLRMLKKKDKLDEALEKKIESAKIKDLEMIAKREALSISTYMDKELAIRFLMENAIPVDPINYTARSEQEEAAAPKETPPGNETDGETLEQLTEAIHTLNERIDALDEKIAEMNGTTSVSFASRLFYIALVIAILILLIITAGFRYPETEPFHTVIRVLNIVEIQDRGIIDLYHALLRFILGG